MNKHSEDAEVTGQVAMTVPREVTAEKLTDEEIRDPNKKLGSEMKTIDGARDVTAETLTIEQVRKHLQEVSLDCTAAMNVDFVHHAYAARARIAAAINARAKAGSR